MDDLQFQVHADIEDQHWWFTGRRHIIESVLRAAVPPSKDATIVEIGMGTGGNLKTLADEYRCVGIEVTKIAFDHAVKRLKGVECLFGDALTEHSKRVTEADCVLILDVLEHIEEHVAFARGVFELMKPGATVIITVPACPWLWSTHDETHDHFRRYVPDTLRSLWADQPMEEQLVSHFNARLYPVVRAVRWINARLRRTIGPAGTDLRLPLAPVNATLRRLFGGEANRLRQSLGGDGGYQKGVSLMAVLKRAPVETGTSAEDVRKNNARDSMLQRS